MNAVMAGRVFVISEHCAPRPSVRRRGAISCAVTIAHRSDIHRATNPVISIEPTSMGGSHGELTDSHPHFRLSRPASPDQWTRSRRPVVTVAIDPTEAIDNPSRAMCR